MNSLFDLTATTAVVTGSSRGIGLAIARTLLSQGARVLINGYDPEGTRPPHHHIHPARPTRNPR